MISALTSTVSTIVAALTALASLELVQFCAAMFVVFAGEVSADIIHSPPFILFHVKQSRFFIPDRETIPEVITGNATGAFFALTFDIESRTGVTCYQVRPWKQVKNSVFLDIAFVYIVFHI